MARAAEQDWGFTDITRKFERHGKPSRRPAPRVRTQRAPSGGTAHVGIWLSFVALTLVGLVAVNVGLLQKNLEYNGLINEKSELSAENARLSSEVAALSSPERVEQIATRSLGMVPAEKVSYVYISPAETAQSYADLDPLGAGGAGRAAP